MSLFWTFFPLVVFVVVLSWTDLYSHIGYAFNISMSEGLHKFPVVWLQSFLIPVSFLKSEKSRCDYEVLSKLERALRLALSSDERVSYRYSEYNERYVISIESNMVQFSLTSKSVEIDGCNKLIPPRIAFMMLGLANKCHGESNKKKKSLFD